MGAATGGTGCVDPEGIGGADWTTKGVGSTEGATCDGGAVDSTGITGAAGADGIGTGTAGLGLQAMEESTVIAGLLIGAIGATEGVEDATGINGASDTEGAGTDAGNGAWAGWAAAGAGTAAAARAEGAAGGATCAAPRGSTGAAALVAPVSVAPCTCASVSLAWLTGFTATKGMGFANYAQETYQILTSKTKNNTV